MEKYPVEVFNYAGLVEEMSQAGFEKMGEVLSHSLHNLPKAKWVNEKDYFWKSLFNAARSNDMVWLWLATQPYIRV